VTRYIALLRAVNLPGHNKVGMGDLRALLGSLGFSDPQSLLASGNLVFGGDGKTSAQLEALLEAETKKRLGLETDFFVRSAREWKAAVAANPFPAEAKADPGHLVLLCCKDTVAAKNVTVLEEAIKGRERVRAQGRQAYLVYPDGIGTSKLTMAIVERKLGTRGTGRNWNTVLKLAALAGA
jgi:uncharacterized protein (DUF1697 family)